jgi:soluble lytic murein transglycosylase-like protein
LTGVLRNGNILANSFPKFVNGNTKKASILMKSLAILVLVFILFFLVSPSSAGIYRYVDEKGIIYFTNCPRDSKFKLYLEEKEEVEENPTRSISYVKGPNEFDFLISEYSKKYRVDFALIKAMIQAESGFNPYAVSKKGAKGLMQLMPETASRMNVSNIFNPKENIEGGVRYFKYLLSLFNNDIRLSLAAYNAGENLVSDLGSIPPYRETVDYVRKVLNYYQSYKP